MNRRALAIAVLVVLIPLIGYAVMHLLVYALPMSQGGTVLYALFTIILIALGLAIPYWMLKLGAHSAHLNNPEEPEIDLSDIPKDQQESKPVTPAESSRRAGGWPKATAANGRNPPTGHASAS